MRGQRLGRQDFLARVHRPVEQGIEGKIVALRIDAHRLQRLVGGARLQRQAQPGQARLADGVHIGQAGLHIGQPRVQRRLHVHGFVGAGVRDDTAGRPAAAPTQLSLRGVKPRSHSDSIASSSSSSMAAASR